MNGSVFSKGQAYEWGRFRNTGSHVRTKIIPRLPPYPPPPQHTHTRGIVAPSEACGIQICKQYVPLTRLRRICRLPVSEIRTKKNSNKGLSARVIVRKTGIKLKSGISCFFVFFVHFITANVCSFVKLILQRLTQ